MDSPQNPPTLLGMPLNVLKKIIADVGIVGRQSLRKTNKGLRHFVDAHGQTLKLLDLIVLLDPMRIEVSYITLTEWISLEYKKTRDGCYVCNKTKNPTQFIKITSANALYTIFARDLQLILMHQKERLTRFDLRADRDYKKLTQKQFKIIADALKLDNTLLKVDEIYIGVPNGNCALAVLQAVDPNAECISVFEPIEHLYKPSDESVNPVSFKLDRIAELPHWKLAKRVNLGVTIHEIAEVPRLCETQSCSFWSYNMSGLIELAENFVRSTCTFLKVEDMDVVEGPHMWREQWTQHAGIPLSHTYNNRLCDIWFFRNPYSATVIMITMCVDFVELYRNAPIELFSGVQVNVQEMWIH